MKKEKKYLDYDSIKRTISILKVLTEHYNWGRFLETIFEGRTYTGKCPICETERGNPLRITIEEGTSAWLSGDPSLQLTHGVNDGEPTPFPNPSFTPLPTIIPAR